MVTGVVPQTGASGTLPPPPGVPPPGEPELCGLGSPTVKSAALSSVCGPAVREADVEFERLAAGVPSAPTVAVPYPTRSTTLPVPAQVLQVSAVRVLVSATFPAVALRLRLPVASGAGSACVPPAPALPCTR